MNHLFPQTKNQIVPLLFFYMNGVGIKQPTKFDMPLNDKTKQRINQFLFFFLFVVFVFVSLYLFFRSFFFSHFCLSSYPPFFILQRTNL